MKKNNLLFVSAFLILLFISCNENNITDQNTSQDKMPDIEWQKCYGGYYDDVAYSIQQTTDGGYIICGYTYSSDRDVTLNKGGRDYWVIKLSPNSIIEWQKTFGGSDDDFAESIRQTTDGGYIVCGWTESSDGDISDNDGKSQGWIIKLSSNGNILWQKSLDDYLNDVQQTKDGGYIVCGSNINKLDIYGNVIWEHYINMKSLISIEQTIDGGYIACGYHYGNIEIESNFYVIKFNSDGLTEWEKVFKDKHIGLANSVKQTFDGGYIVCGALQPSFAKTDSDYWILKLSLSGNIEWETNIGGSDYDEAEDIQQTKDGGYIVCGISFSVNGDVTNNKGEADYWIVKLTPGGSIEWEKTFGGSKRERATSIKQTTDGGYIFCGATESIDGVVTGNNGNADIWIVKLRKF